MRVRVLLIVILAGLPATARGQIRPDSTIVQTDENSRTPSGALWRGLVLPGFGQAYNRQYVKMGVVLLAVGGLTANVVHLTDRHRLYTRAFQFKAFEEQLSEGEINPRAEFEDEYVELLAEKGLSEISSAAIKPVRDKLRRNRDLSVLGTGLVYALSVLDAYVSAHLADFDVSDDLTIRVNPEIGPNLQPRASFSIRIGL